MPQADAADERRLSDEARENAAQAHRLELGKVRDEYEARLRELRAELGERESELVGLADAVRRYQHDEHTRKVEQAAQLEEVKVANEAAIEAALREAAVTHRAELAATRSEAARQVSDL